MAWEMEVVKLLLKGEGAPSALPWYSDARKVMSGPLPTKMRWILREYQWRW